MKMKIVIRVEMNCDKCRSKAMTIAAAVQGIDSVAIAGSDGTQLVVVGDNVDPVKLTESLRKKFDHASIVSVGEAKEAAAGSNRPEIFSSPAAVEWSVQSFPTYYYPPYPVQYDHYVDDYNRSSCPLM